MHTEQERLLTLCRAAMPSVSGVVLSTISGAVVAHEADRVANASAIAARAVVERLAPTSTIVQDAAGSFLVVFVPDPLVDQFALSGAPAIAA